MIKTHTQKKPSDSDLFVWVFEYYGIAVLGTHTGGNVSQLRGPSPRGRGRHMALKPWPIFMYR